MNRFKKELRKRGIKLESDYPFIPYNGLEAIIVHSDTATVSEYHDCAGWVRTSFARNMEMSTVMDL